MSEIGRWLVTLRLWLQTATTTSLGSDSGHLRLRRWKDDAAGWTRKRFSTRFTHTIHDVQKTDSYPKNRRCASSVRFVKKAVGGGSFRTKGPKPEACMQQAQAPLLTSILPSFSRAESRAESGNVVFLGRGAASPLPISYKPWPPRVFLEHYKAQETRINEWYITSRPILVKPTHPDQYFQ